MNRGDLPLTTQQVLKSLRINVMMFPKRAMYLYNLMTMGFIY